jgi:hypothetical protein
MIGVGAVMRRRGVLLAVASAALAGCTILHSSSNPTEGGIAYHLPRSVVVAKVDLWKRLKEPEVKAANGTIISPAKYEFLVTFDTDKVSSSDDKKKTRGETVPDLNDRFVLAYSSNPLFNDRYCVTTEQNGLLTSVEYATEDETPKVVLALAELGRKLTAQGFARGPEGAGDTPEASAIVTFNPFDPNDRHAAAQVVNNTFGRQLNGSNKVNVEFNFPELQRFGQKQVDNHKCRGDRGVCFRTVVRTPMRLRDANDPGKVLTTNVMIDVVNPHYVGVFDLDRAFMVEKIVRLGFKDGALTQVIMRKPSEALQTVKLPLAVVEALLAVPANFIATAAGSNQAINDQLQAQRDAVKNIQDQLLSTALTDERSLYKEKCKGNVFNTNG